MKVAIKEIAFITDEKRLENILKPVGYESAELRERLLLALPCDLIQPVLDDLHDAGESVDGNGTPTRICLASEVDSGAYGVPVTAHGDSRRYILDVGKNFPCITVSVIQKVDA